jgi:hypothetical protein
MNYRSVSLSHAYAAIIGGIVLCIYPQVILNFLEISLSDGLVLVSRLYGAFLFGLGFSIYSTRDAQIFPFPLVAANALVDLVAAGIFLQATLNGTVGWAGYIFTGMFAMNLLSWLVILPQRHQMQSA